MLMLNFLNDNFALCILQFNELSLEEVFSLALCVSATYTRAGNFRQP